MDHHQSEVPSDRRSALSLRVHRRHQVDTLDGQQGRLADGHQGWDVACYAELGESGGKIIGPGLVEGPGFEVSTARGRATGTGSDH